MRFLVGAVAALALVSRAHASEVMISVLPDGSAIEAEITELPEGVTPDQVTIEYDGKRVPAVGMRTYAEAGLPIALAIVFNSSEMLMGTDHFENEADDGGFNSVGFEALRNGLSIARFNEGLPAGSVALLIGYDDKARVIWPVSPIKELDGRALGTKRDYRNHVGTELVRGIRLALDELEKLSSPRKALIVIGDGNDTNVDLAPKFLAELRGRAGKMTVGTFGIIYKSAVSMEGQTISHFTSNLKTVNSVESFSRAIVDQIDHLRDRKFFRFPATALAHDGKRHDYTIRIGERALEPVEIGLPLPPAPAPPSRTWLWLAIAGVLVVAAALFVYLRRLRPAV